MQRRHFFEGERAQRRGVGGGIFGRSVAKKKMRKEGLGTVGLLQDVVSGRQEYRKTERGGDTKPAALLFDL